jgi:ABC-type phosphate transport system substrate-binding protein
MRLFELKSHLARPTARCFIVGLSLMGLSASAADIVVIASASSGVSQLSKDQVSNLFLGKSTALPSGGKAILIDQPDSSPMRDAFYSKVTGKSASQVKSTWAKLSFTGKGTPPNEGSGNDDIKKQIAGNPNMLGYLDKTALDSSVKVVFTP